MSTSMVEIEVPFAQEVTVTDDTLGVELSDGRSIAVPLGWYPRLVHATALERNNWKLIGKGEGIHWPDLDEDISVEGLLAGKPADGLFQRLLHRRRLCLYLEPVVSGPLVLDDQGYFLTVHQRRGDSD